MSEPMQPHRDTLPAAFFVEACAYWEAMRAVIDDGARRGSSAPLILLAGAALELAFKAVLASSGWSAGALDAIDHDLEAAWGAALDCGLMPRRVDEAGDLVGTIVTARVGQPGANPGGGALADMANAVPLIGSLIVDVGEQFGSIGEGLR